MAKFSKIILVVGLILGFYNSYAACDYSSDATITTAAEINGCSGTINVMNGAVVTIDLPASETAITTALTINVQGTGSTINISGGEFSEKVTINDKAESNPAEKVILGGDDLIFTNDVEVVQSGKNTDVEIVGDVDGNVTIKYGNDGNNSFSISDADISGDLLVIGTGSYADLDDLSASGTITVGGDFSIQANASVDLDLVNTSITMDGDILWTKVVTDFDNSTVRAVGSADIVGTTLHLDNNSKLYIEGADVNIAQSSTLILESGTLAEITGDIGVSGGTAKIVVYDDAHLSVNGNLESGANITFDVYGKLDILELWSTSGAVNIYDGAEVSTNRHQHTNSDFVMDGGTFKIDGTFEPASGNFKLNEGILTADTINIYSVISVKNTNFFSKLMVAKNQVNYSGGTGCFGFNVCMTDMTDPLQVEMFCDDESGSVECYDCNGTCTTTATTLDAGGTATIYECGNCVYYYEDAKNDYHFVTDGTIFNPDYSLSPLVNNTAVPDRNNNCTNMVKNSKVCNTLSLPVDLSYFEVEKQDETTAKLTWVTSSEKNNDFFTITRSTNGEDFEYVGTVGGAGNSSSAIMYEFVDDVPYEGYVYYQLIQTDYDGTQSGSNIKTVYFGEKDFSIYPNQLYQNEEITISGVPAGTSFIISTTSVNGSLVTYEGVRNEFGDFKYTVNNPRGTYILSVILPDEVINHVYIVK